MKLSIGMIVKNEELYLDKCLSALQPILDNVDSELIIVDTGSTDKTVDIAKKYTNKVYFFEWINDFAVARNEGLKYATGEWFLFIDADEILQDAKEIIQFFNTNEYKKYNSAYIQLINYSNNIKAVSAPVQLPRLNKIYPDTKFVGKIHEVIVNKAPEKELYNTVFDHYGYAFSDPTQAKKKAKRNIELMEKELLSKPDVALLRSQLCDSYEMLGDHDKVIEHAKEGLKIFEKTGNVQAFFTLKFNLIVGYMSIGKYALAIDEINDYLNRLDTIHLSHIDAYYYLTGAYFSLCRYEECTDAFEKYLNTIVLNRKSPIRSIDTKHRSVLRADDISINNLILVAATAYIKEENYTRAKKILDFDTMHNLEYVEKLTSYYNIEFTLMEKINSFSKITSLYNSLIEKDYPSSFIDDFENCIENSIIKHYILNKNDIVCNIKTAVNLITNKERDYIKYVCYLYNNPNATYDNIIYLTNTINNIDIKYTDLFYYIFKFNVPLSNIYNKINVEDIFNLVQQTYNKYYDFLDILKEYTSKLKLNTSIDFLWHLCYSVLKLSNKETHSNSLHFYKVFLDLSKQYFEEISLDTYLVNHNGHVNLLPDNFRFTYSIMLAYEFFTQKKYYDYAKELKIASNYDKSMNGLIELLLDELKKIDNIQNLEQKEFRELSNQIKANINFLIKNKNCQEALELLNEYKNINPLDKDIERLEASILSLS